MTGEERYLGDTPIYQMSTPDTTFEVYTNCMSAGDLIPMMPPTLKICGCCGRKGKCISANGHKGKHRAANGFEWL